MVESIGTDSINHMLPDDDDDSLSPFISGDLLKHTILFPSGNIFFYKVSISVNIFIINYPAQVTQCYLMRMMDFRL